MVLKKYCSVFALLLVGGVQIADKPGHAQTLQQAVNQIITSNPDVRSVAHNRLARDEEVRQAKADYFPSVNFEAGTGRDYVDKPFDDDLSPQQVKIGVRQNIFAGLSTMNEVARQKARVESEAYIVRSTADSTALKAVNVYLEVLKSQAIVDLAEENLTLHQRIADQIKLRSESGVDRLADMDQIQSRLNLALSNLVVAEQGLLDAQTNYNAVIGNPPLELTRPDNPAPMLPASREEAERLAIANHPQLKSAAADLEARRKQDEVAKSPFMPIVDLEADKVWEEDTYLSDYYDGDKREDLRIFLRLRYNLFNGWRDEARKNETAHLINEAREIKNHTYRQVVESIRLSWQAHEASQKKINYLRQRLQFAASTANAYTKQWNIGQRTLLDVLDAEAERIDSARQLVTAEHDGLYADYRILNGVGKLIPSLDLQWPEEGAVKDKEFNLSTEPETGAVKKPAKKIARAETEATTASAASATGRSSMKLNPLTME
ncbi:TolC family outer membrane protein [Desulfobulbus sp.]|uniref:TolC family outer membrane protein n=1 Tax=Desulfobulbus sp. TaxID=895 RepID=UPI00286EC124|nr:TolC family outer membrane protein [Desulfobulbus sp.]